ncbi:Stp1/IreP family PP2C-type Ser/Thr phosphatase [Myxococcus sp. MISCRS1]|uniref:Stp1/IreP family PP2C-type Ser/Thr phosphatase n=1 Tax=Myxococcus TaxID=32 RepID=UPI00114172ED|nr:MULTISPECIES: Stp1/IreP family PP2C-type Ser/Thr phosphatase [unclassified Myxococcus]MBZ4401630.1 Stp1/IreP family PP2C-type Ser/Thr phosphatase [Myxococcus sp. AS-1-15]MBZ4409355.1 Stp1/IreP family PP2C-type Ser/Thr phosphatase [Myxococcus sp. XM-1-1-1]MCK8501735.1 Stp1/IreP family PP2C-type Ser/Thr phosphatase [Myxococcus fulvus]MCY1002905.1 Stp1/IreP family PP2C-type Ser/Thr phosphatase [Myxococcus sp. MISCRS1]
MFAVALTTEAFGLTDVGRKRQHNEDAMLVDVSLGLYVVADGMGGHAAGEVASNRATEVVKQHITANRHLLKDLGNNPTADSRSAAAALVEVAVQRACADIYRTAMSDSTKRGMGTTFVCLAVGGNKAVIGHVGDSRVYLVRHGQCHRLTEDHTLVAAQLKAGTITKEQAATSQYRNVITRAVGIQESVQVDTLIVDLVPGDMFVLCSDGLHGYVEDEELLPLVSGLAPGDLPKRLIDIANERGGKDNITAVVVKIAGDSAALASEESSEAQSRMEALRKIPLFRHLTYKEQTAVLSIATTRTYPAGREIVVEGQPGEELFVVIRGRVAIEKNGVEIAELRSGGHFGEMGLIDNAPRSATVRATEPTRTMVISRPDLMGLMKRESILAVKMLWSFVQVLSDRLRATNSELSEARQELAVAQAIQPFAEE